MANNNLNTANQMQNAPLNYFNQFNQNANNIAGNGSSDSKNNPGNPFLGALGGFQLGSRIGQKSPVQQGI